MGGYDEEACLVEDYDYWLRVGKMFQLLHFENALYYYRTHEKSLTAKYTTPLSWHILGILLLLKNNYTDLAQASQSMVAYITAKNWFFQFETKAFRWYPVNPKMYKKFLISQFNKYKAQNHISKVLKAFMDKSINLHIACNKLSGISQQYIQRRHD